MGAFGVGEMGIGYYWWLRSLLGVRRSRFVVILNGDGESVGVMTARNKGEEKVIA